MGVQFFGEDFPDDFGPFSKAALTMFQISTFDSWVSGETRPVCFRYPDTPYTFFFFITYAFAAGIMMLNVAVAVLVDRFVEVASSEEQNRKMMKARASQWKQIMRAVATIQKQA